MSKPKATTASTTEPAGAQPTGAQILATPMDDNDAGAATIGDYLRKLLLGVWRDEGATGGGR